MYIRAFRTYKSVDMYSCITVRSERTSQLLCTHVSQSNHNLQVSSDILMNIRTVRTYTSEVMYSCISEQSELTEVIYSCISEQSELTCHQLCTHVSQSIQNLQVSSYVLVHLRAFITYKSVVMYSCISEQSELTSQ